MKKVITLVFLIIVIGLTNVNYGQMAIPHPRGMSVSPALKLTPEQDKAVTVSILILAATFVTNEIFIREGHTKPTAGIYISGVSLMTINYLVLPDLLKKYPRNKFRYRKKLRKR